MSNPASDAARAALKHSRTRDINEQAQNSDAYGSAKILTEQEAADAGLLTSDYRNAPILMGRAADPPFGTYARYTGDGHILTLAPTGAGKTVGAVMPNHLYPGSMFIIDPKGNVPKMGARLRRDVLKQEVRVLDPWGISGLPSDAINPLDLLDPDSEDTIDDARTLAESLILAEGGDNSYWSDLGRSLVTAFLVHIVTYYPPEERNIQTLLDMAYCGLEKFSQIYLPELMMNRAFDGWFDETVGFLESAYSSEKISASVFATIQRSLEFLRSPRMKRALIPDPAQKTFTFADLKRRPMTVYLVIPPERLESYGRWLRLMLSQAIIEVSREKQQVFDSRGKSHPVLFLLDEFPALKRLEIIETAIGLMRGYGIKLWPIVQDLSQLKDLYPHRWSSFLANAGVLQVFNVNDVDTAEYISKRMGSETRITTRLQASVEDTINADRIARPLLTADEVMRLPRDKQLLFYQGEAPFVVQGLRHFAEPELKDFFDADPLR